MKKHIFAILLVAIAVAACNSETSPPQSGSTNADEVATVVIFRRDAAVLMGDYRPTFAHRVRSQRHEALGGGKYQHIVIVEYMDAGEKFVGTVLSDDLAARGLDVIGPVDHDGVARYLATNSGIGKMFADVNASPAVELSPGARGTIYFSWRDTQSR